MDTIKDEMVKARKPHRCIWCGETIEKGEVHQSRAYRFDGEFMHDRLHVECKEAMDKADFIEDGFVAYSAPRGDYAW
jgi:hypothetical protein